LKYIGQQKLVHGIQHKLLIKLMGYDYKIEYKKGKENKVVDALSRRPQENTLMSISTAVSLWINDVLSSYIDDPKCKEVQEQLRINPASAPNFSLSNDIIRYKNRIVVENNTELRKQLIESFHTLCWVVIQEKG
jgi:hypothetical protein